MLTQTTRLYKDILRMSLTFLLQLIYCGIPLIRGCYCSLIVKSLLARGDVLSWGTGLLHLNARQFISLLNVRGEIIRR